MSITAVGNCSHCAAVVNVHWASCLVCHSPIEPRNLPAPLQDNRTSSAQSPEAPIRPGWLVAYRDRHGALVGGSDDRARGTVQECRWEAGRWTVFLTNGQQVPLSQVVGVVKTGATGRIIVAWTVRRHGYDGEQPSSSLT